MNNWREELSQLKAVHDLERIGRTEEIEQIKAFISTLLLTQLEEIEGLLPVTTPKKYLSADYFYGYTAVGAYELALQDVRSLLANKKKFL